MAALSQKRAQSPLGSGPHASSLATSGNLSASYTVHAEKTETMPDDPQTIEGVLVKSLRRFADHRGWLIELFRDDELPPGFDPAMAYISSTKPGIARGPHEHVHQTDGFAFVDGAFQLYLWDTRSGRPQTHLRLLVGEQNPVFVTVPPGVVHAYRNVCDRDAFVVNLPDTLYAGKNRAEPVDEIRHEDDPDSRFPL